jgi:hypothetical protein
MNQVPPSKYGLKGNSYLKEVILAFLRQNPRPERFTTEQLSEKLSQPVDEIRGAISLLKKDLDGYLINEKVWSEEKQKILYYLGEGALQLEDRELLKKASVSLPRVKHVPRETQRSPQNLEALAKKIVGMIPPPTIDYDKLAVSLSKLKQ